MEQTLAGTASIVLQRLDFSYIRYFIREGKVGVGLFQARWPRHRHADALPHVRHLRADDRQGPGGLEKARQASSPGITCKESIVLSREKESDQRKIPIKRQTI